MLFPRLLVSLPLCDCNVYIQLQAFQSVIANATAGAYPNVSADDIRALIPLEFFATAPNFTEFNLALAAATQGDASAFTYNGEFAAGFSAGVASTVALFCPDARECVLQIYII